MSKKLKKKYRVIWNKDNEIVNNPEEEFNKGSVTYLPKQLEGFDTNNKKEIEKYIKKNKLKKIKKDDDLHFIEEDINARTNKNTT